MGPTRAQGSTSLLSFIRLPEIKGPIRVQWSFGEYHKPKAFWWKQKYCNSLRPTEKVFFLMVLFDILGTSTIRLIIVNYHSWIINFVSRFSWPTMERNMTMQTSLFRYSKMKRSLILILLYLGYRMTLGQLLLTNGKIFLWVSVGRKLLDGVKDARILVRSEK